MAGGSGAGNETMLMGEYAGSHFIWVVPGGHHQENFLRMLMTEEHSIVCALSPVRPLMGQLQGHELHGLSAFHATIYIYKSWFN